MCQQELERVAVWAAPWASAGKCTRAEWGTMCQQELERVAVWAGQALE
jgi:hypothetical protein